MTRLDVKNYLTQIYKIPTMDVKTINLSGENYVLRFFHNFFLNVTILGSDFIDSSLSFFDMNSVVKK